MPEEEFNILAEDINRRFSSFYGIVYHSRLISADTLSIKSCWGQFLSLYKEIPSAAVNNSGQPLQSISYLKNIEFDPSKKTAVFLFSNFYASQEMKRIRPILDALKSDPEFDYVVISLDHPKYLKI